MDFSFNPDDLTKEKSLWKIYLYSRKIKTTFFNKIILITSTILLVSYAFYIEPNTTLMLSKLRNIAEISLGFSVSILGFLIAGFTIFATLTKPYMLLKMMDIQHNDSGLPYLKYNFFAFIRVFIFYLSISSIFLVVILFGDKNGVFSKIINSLPGADISRPIVIRIVYIVLSLCTIYLLLLLKTFIFNIYSIVMNHLRWEHYEWKDNKGNPADEKNQKICSCQRGHPLNTKEVVKRKNIPP